MDRRPEVVQSGVLLMGNKYLDLLKQVLGSDYVPTLHLAECPHCWGVGKYQKTTDGPWTHCNVCDGKGKVLMKESDFKIWEYNIEDIR